MRKSLTALALAAAMTLAAVAAPPPAEARNRGGAVAGAIIGGLAAGAIIGAMANRGGYYYGPGYYYDDGPYYYGGPYDYDGPYVVVPAPRVYVRPAPYRGGCFVYTDRDRGYGYYGPCR